MLYEIFQKYFEVHYFEELHATNEKKKIQNIKHLNLKIHQFKILTYKKKSML